MFGVEALQDFGDGFAELLALDELVRGESDGDIELVAELGFDVAEVCAGHAVRDEGAEFGEGGAGGAFEGLQVAVEALEALFEGFVVGVLAEIVLELHEHGEGAGELEALEGVLFQVVAFVAGDGFVFFVLLREEGLEFGAEVGGKRSMDCMVRPCLMAFLEDSNLPASVRGPPERLVVWLVMIVVPFRAQKMGEPIRFAWEARPACEERNSMGGL